MAAILSDLRTPCNPLGSPPAITESLCAGVGGQHPADGADGVDQVQLCCKESLRAKVETEAWKATSQTASLDDGQVS